MFDDNQMIGDQRSSFVKSLSEQLNAEYYHGFDKIRNKYRLGLSGSDSFLSMYKTPNTIVGEKNGYEYCFYEYSYISGKNRTIHWQSCFHLRLKENYPNFQLLTKRRWITQWGFCSLIGVPWAGIGIGTIFYTIMYDILPKLKDASGLIITNILPSLLFGLFLLSIGLLIFYVCYKKLSLIKEQAKYNINNYKFKNKYFILTEAKEQRIRDVFDEKVCEKLVDFSPEITMITCQSNCLITAFNNDEKLSLNRCKSILDNAINQAIIFDNKNSEF